MLRLMTSLAVAAILVGGALVGFSGASFTSGSTSSVGVKTDRIQNWLHLYSQGTDPEGLTDYCTQAPGADPAATGMDDSLTVDLGTLPSRGTTTCGRVFTIRTPATYPEGGSATIAASVVADPHTGEQPVTNIGFSDLGKSNGFTNPISVGTSETRQLNLRVKRVPSGIVSHLTILVTVTYADMTATYYQYSVPVTLAGS